VQERGRRQPRHQRRVLDRVPHPVAAPVELVVGPARAQHDPEAERAPGGQGERPRRPDPLRVEPARDQGRHRERERDGEQRVARIEHRRVDHHPGVAQQRVQPGALADHPRRARERRLGEHQQGCEERAEPEQDRGGVGRQHPQPVAREEQDQARPGAEQEQPQQQRALLRGPHGRQPVEQRRRRRGVRGDDRELEVRAHERGLQQHERDRAGQRHRVHGAAPGRDPLPPARARAVQRRRDAVERAGEGDDQAGLARDEHVTSGSCPP
jgi:hypothetical protein